MDNAPGSGACLPAGSQNEPFFDLLHHVGSASGSNSQVHASNNSNKRVDNPLEEFNFGGDDVLPSFDFQPYRNVGASSTTKLAFPSSVSKAEENRDRERLAPPVNSYEPMIRHRPRDPPPTYEAPAPAPHEQGKDAFDYNTVAFVEKTMKKYADNLLCVLEGMSGRLSQLETATKRLELVSADIKGCVLDNYDEMDRKLRGLENHLVEVQWGVQLLRDKEEIAKLRLSSVKSELPVTTPSAPPSSVPESAPQLSRASSGKALTEAPHQQSTTSPPAPLLHYLPQPQQLPAPPAPLSQPPQSQAPPQQQPHQLQQSAVSNADISQQGMLHQHTPPPPPSPGLPTEQHSHPGQHPMQPFYPQQQHQQVQPPQQPPNQSYGHPVEVPPYNQHPQGQPSGAHHVGMPPNSYTGEVPSYLPGNYSQVPRDGHQPPLQHPPSQQQQHGSGVFGPQAMLGRSGSGQMVSGQLALHPPYLPQSQPLSPPHYDSQSVTSSGAYPGSFRVAQPVPSAPNSGSGGYPRLPVAQPLQHALPAGGSGGPSGPPAGFPSTNRVPIDEVIGKVTAMGFSKEQVRAVVRRLTENGQSVDLNIVLDKLMNEGEAPPKGWFGR